MKLNKIILLIATMLITLGMAHTALADGVNLSSDSAQITNNNARTERITITRVYRVCGIATAQTKRVTLDTGFMQVEPISTGQPARLIVTDDSNGIYISKIMY